MIAGHMTPTEQIGSAVFFFALIPALIIYGKDVFAEPDPRAVADRAAMQAARSAR